MSSIGIPISGQVAKQQKEIMQRILGRMIGVTLPETNGLHLKLDGWKTSFLWDGVFSGHFRAILVFRSVTGTSQSFIYHHQSSVAADCDDGYNFFSHHIADRLWVITWWASQGN